MKQLVHAHATATTGNTELTLLRNKDKQTYKCNNLTNIYVMTWGGNPYRREHQGSVSEAHLLDQTWRRHRKESVSPRLSLRIAEFSKASADSPFVSQPSMHRGEKLEGALEDIRREKVM